MAVIIKKIVKNFDDKWVRILFHEPDFLKPLLLLSLAKQLYLIIMPFYGDFFIIVFPNGTVYTSLATRSNVVSLDWLK